VVTDIEVFYTHMLIVNFYFCRLTFLLHTLHHMHPHMTQSVIARGSCLFSGKVKRSGTGLALACSRDALASSEALLTTILSIKDRELLATAPDSVFGMISFAAAWVTTTRFLMLQSKVMRSVPGSSGELLARTIKCLQQVSLSTDDNASRCARVISGFVDTWEKKQRTQDAEVATMTPGQRNDTPQAAPPLPSAAKATHHGYTNSQSTMTGPSPETTTSSPSDLDYIFDQDVLLGLDFWQYLAELPNIQPDINPTCEWHFVLLTEFLSLTEINLSRHTIVIHDIANVYPFDSNSKVLYICRDTAVRYCTVFGSYLFGLGPLAGRLLPSHSTSVGDPYN